MPNTISTNDPLFHHSGVNSSFHAVGGKFQDYITQCQTTIATGRIDLTPENFNQVMAAISPFELRPDAPTKKGILLIHGLYDSPFTWHDLAPQFAAEGFLVRSIMLPGHCTVPGDLSTIEYSQWLKAAEFGIQSLSQDVSEIYIAAFSMGCPIAIELAFKHPQIKGMVLIAPALKPKRFAANFAQILTLLGKVYSPLAWYQLSTQHVFVKYESYPCNAANQFCQLVKKTHRTLKKNRLTIPLLVIASADDETVSERAILNFFIKQPNRNNRLLIYGNMDKLPLDPRIQRKSSLFPEQKILDFSHICMAISPTNFYLGSQGTYQDFHHYKGKIPSSNKDIYQGAVKLANLGQHVLRRLTYNPDFSYMSNMIKDFLRYN